MNTTRRDTILLIVCLLSTGFASGASAAQDRGATVRQLQLLVPGPQDLQGFMQVRPAGELPEGWAVNIWSPQTQTITVPVSPAVPIEDRVTPPFEDTEDTPTLTRTLYTVDGLYRMQIGVTLYPTPAVAAEEITAYRKSGESGFTRGAFNGKPAVGDESWVLPSMLGSTDNVLITRVGRLMVFVSGGLSSAAARHQVRAELPKAVVEAAAYQVLLRAFQQAKLTGVPSPSTHLAVNGHALPKNALLVGKQTYVPVKEFARAMGLASAWDTKTGALTLTGAGRKTIALTAGSTAATVGGTKAAALAVPVLKDAGEPVMALSDLLALTGGRITGRAGNTVQVKG